VGNHATRRQALDFSGLAPQGERRPDLGVSRKPEEERAEGEAVSRSPRSRVSTVGARWLRSLADLPRGSARGWWEWKPNQNLRAL